MRSAFILLFLALMSMLMVIFVSASSDFHLPMMDEDDDIMLNDNSDTEYNTNFGFDTINIPSEMHFSIGSVEVAEVPTDEIDHRYSAELHQIYRNMPRLNFHANEVNNDMETMASAVDWAMVINIAKKAWEFIQDNKAVSNVHTSFANALPKGVSSAYELEQWKPPVTRGFSITYKNLLNVKVIDMSFTMTFVPGGKYNGKGLYLDRIGMIPKSVWVAWGFRLDADVTVPSVVNAGTSANPKAGAQVELHYKVSSLNSHTATMTYYVEADGRVMQM